MTKLHYRWGDRLSSGLCGDLRNSRARVGDWAVMINSGTQLRLYSVSQTQNHSSSHTSAGASRPISDIACVPQRSLSAFTTTRKRMGGEGIQQQLRQRQFIKHCCLMMPTHVDSGLTILTLYISFTDTKGNCSVPEPALG